MILLGRVVRRHDLGVTTAFGGEGEVISLITRASVEDLWTAVGKQVVASVKASALHVVAG